MRKSIIALILLLLLSMNIAHAETIMFLDLPWGASYIDFVQALINNGVDGKTPCTLDVNKDNFTLSSYTTHDHSKYGDTYTELWTMTVDLYNAGEKIWEIGGQDVYKITGTFVPGTIIKDDGKSHYTSDYAFARLVRVELELGRREATAFGNTRIGFDTLFDVYNDIKTKLQAVYGDFCYSDKEGKYTYTYTWSQDDGWVELKRIYASLSQNGITVEGVDTYLTDGFDDGRFITNIWKDYHKDDLKGL